MYHRPSIRRLSICHLSVSLLSSVTFIHRTQAIEIFTSISTPLDTLAVCCHLGKTYEDRPRGTLASGELNTRGVAEYSDFGPIERYISETLQDKS